MGEKTSGGIERSDAECQVSTRFLSIFSPAQSITLSVYGYPPASSPSSIDPLKQAASAHVAVTDRPRNLTVENNDKDDTQWAMEWAGGPDRLASLIEDPSTPMTHRTRAIQSLSLLPIPHVRQTLTRYSDAIPYMAQTDTWADLTSLDQYKGQVDWSFFLHPSAAPTIPPAHILHLICSATEADRVGIAWRRLDHPVYLDYLVYVQQQMSTAGSQTISHLLECPPGISDSTRALLVAEHPNMTSLGSSSRLHLLLSAAETYAADLRPHTQLGQCVDLLSSALSCLEAGSAGQIDAQRDHAIVHLARIMPRLVLTYNVGLDALSGRLDSGTSEKQVTKGARGLDMPCLAREAAIRIMREQLKLLSSAIIFHRPAKSYTQHLLSTLPLPPISRTPLPSMDSNGSLSATKIALQLHSASNTDRASARFLTHLDDPTRPSGLVHSFSPGDIIKHLAPNLYTSLSTAREPLFGILPADAGSKAGAQASDFAGKVYTRHEFRNRGQPSGLAGAQGTTQSVVSGAGIGLSMGVRPDRGMTVSPLPSSAASLVSVAASGGIGIGALAVPGAGAGRISRPASRHVDDYAM